MESTSGLFWLNYLSSGLNIFPTTIMIDLVIKAGFCHVDD